VERTLAAGYVTLPFGPAVHGGLLPDPGTTDWSRSPVPLLMGVTADDFVLPYLWHLLDAERVHDALGDTPSWWLADNLHQAGQVHYDRFPGLAAQPWLSLHLGRRDRWRPASGPGRLNGRPSVHTQHACGVNAESHLFRASRHRVRGRR
jgi:hypothetical protein